MKNQNDLIVSIVAGVLTIIFGIVFYVTKRDVTPPAPAPQVNLGALQAPTGDVVMANGLGGGSGAGGAMGGPGGAGFGAPMMSGPSGAGGAPLGNPNKAMPGAMGAMSMGGR